MPLLLKCLLDVKIIFYPAMLVCITHSNAMAEMTWTRSRSMVRDRSGAGSVSLGTDLTSWAHLFYSSAFRKHFPCIFNRPLAKTKTCVCACFVCVRFCVLCVCVWVLWIIFNWHMYKTRLMDADDHNKVLQSLKCNENEMSTCARDSTIDYVITSLFNIKIV